MLARSILAFIFASSIAVQNLGTILGVVTDRSGGVLPGVTVTVVDQERGTSRVVVTDSKGVFVVTALRQGRYSVRVELPGFDTFRAEGVVVQGGKTTHMPITLSIATVSETVTVTGEYAPGRFRTKVSRGKRVAPVQGASPWVRGG